jgi:hypothetical protein
MHVNKGRKELLIIYVWDEPFSPPARPTVVAGVETQLV